MHAIQVVLDKDLLKAADRAARQEGVNRSALIRDALRAHLKRLRIREIEDRERRAYEAIPDNNEFAALQRITAWPEDLFVGKFGSAGLQHQTKSAPSWFSLETPCLTGVAM